MSSHEPATEAARAWRLGLVQDPLRCALIEAHLRDGCASCEAAVLEAAQLESLILSALEWIPPSEFGRARLVRALRASGRDDSEG